MTSVVRSNRLLVSAALWIAASAVPARPVAAASADRAAAIVTYPHVIVDAGRGIDTFVQLSNRDTAPVDVLCFLENTNRHCGGSGAVCGSDADCLPDLCVAGWQAVDFAFHLTERQPIGWHVSSGSPALSLPGDGSIPPAFEHPFQGLLRCVVTDDLGVPSDRNVLSGVATLERYEAGPSPALDAARYNAVGIEALPGANDGDNVLVLGGPEGEYEACPAALVLNHVFDLAVEPITRGSQVLTDLVLVPCSGDFFLQEPGATVVQFVVVNEFEQVFSSSRALSARHARQISLIDSNIPDRSIFSAGVAGTLTGQTRITPFGAGVLGVAVERHYALGQPAGTSASAAFGLHSLGERVDVDTLVVGPPPLCAESPRSACRTARNTSIAIFDAADDADDALAWRWRQGQATELADLGDPTSTTSYGLCLYAGLDETLVSAATIDPSPNWQALGQKGIKYADRSGAADGVERVIIRGSRRDAARVLLDAAGESLPELASPIAAPLLVQFVNDAGTCFEATYGPDDVIRHEAGRFKARTGR